MVTGRVLVVGSGQGPLMRLGAPISFWGGVDPVSGRVADPRHPDFGRVVTGTVLVVPSAVGSSSSSAVMLEMLRNGTAPAAVVMGEADAILALGVVVARELGHAGIPVVELAADAIASLEEGVMARVGEDGTIAAARPSGP